MFHQRGALCVPGGTWRDGAPMSSSPLRIHNSEEGHRRRQPPPEGHYAPPKWITLRCHNVFTKLSGTRLCTPFINSKPKSALSGSLMHAGGSAASAERLHAFVCTLFPPARRDASPSYVLLISLAPGPLPAVCRRCSSQCGRSWSRAELNTNSAGQRL